MAIWIYEFIHQATGMVIWDSIRLGFTGFPDLFVMMTNTITQTALSDSHLVVGLHLSHNSSYRCESIEVTWEDVDELIVVAIHHWLQRGEKR